MKNKQLVTWNNHRIILSHERREVAKMDVYPLNHLLIYVREGELKIKTGKTIHSFAKGAFVLLKKYTQTHITKTWNKDENLFSSVVFTFQEDLVGEGKINCYIV